MDLEEITTRIAELEGKATDAVEKLEGASSEDDRNAAKAEIERVDETIKPLIAQHEKAMRAEESKALRAQVTTLTEAMEKMREPVDFSFGGTDSDSDEKAVYGHKESDYSFYNDVLLASKGDGKAADRLQSIVEGKAMTVGASAAGGYLVPDQYSQELLELRFQASVLEPLFSRINVQSDTLRIASVTGGLTAGWVAELATKPSADLSFGEISTGVFTIAGLAVASNQLLSYSGSDVDRLVNVELARRIARVFELAVFSGTGTGQPTGILNTAGVNSVTVATTGIDVLLDAIQDAITAVYTEFIDAPNGIVMHPRTWGRIAKAKASSGAYLLGDPSTPFAERSASQNIPGYSSAQTPRGSLFGLPVYTTANVPVNLGAGVNESRVIVGKWDEGLVLSRGGVQVDKSEHVYFTSNQTVFRGEQDIGFTAARYPKAFTVIGGAGLAAG